MKILFQIFLILIISSLVGFALQNIIGFKEAFALAIILQFISPSIYQAITRNRERIAALEGEINEFADMCTCNVPCPCGGYTFNEIIVVSEDSILSKCPVCGNEYRLKPSVSVVLTTEPLNLGRSVEDKEKEL